MSSLFTPIRLGKIDLGNRIVMAPMTRSRASQDGVVGDLTVTYYAQRASVGLIVTEGVFPTASGKSGVGLPGIETDDPPRHERGLRRRRLHGSSGYLSEQFLSFGTNHRIDGYGGSIPNRVRFMLEVSKSKSSLIELGQSPPHQVVGTWTGLWPNIPQADHLG